MRYIPFLKRAAFIFMVILVFVIYMALYFVPVVKTINKSRRHLKDIKMHIQDNIKIEYDFTSVTAKEEALFLKTDQEFFTRLPKISGSEQMDRFISSFLTYIQSLAKQKGITSLFISPNIRVEGLKTLTHDTQSKKFKSRRQFLWGEKDDFWDSVNTHSIKVEKNLVYKAFNSLNKMHHQTLIFSFSGKLENGLNFINHLPLFRYYFTIDKIYISEGSNAPLFIIFCSFYYYEV